VPIYTKWWVLALFRPKWMKFELFFGKYTERTILSGSKLLAPRNMYLLNGQMGYQDKLSRQVFFVKGKIPYTYASVR